METEQTRRLMFVPQRHCFFLILFPRREYVPQPDETKQEPSIMRGEKLRFCARKTNIHFVAIFVGCQRVSFLR